jgi:5'-nucleotidase
MPVRRPVLSALAGVGTAVLAAGLLAAPAQAAPLSVRVLTINDFHGRLVADARAGIPGAALLAGAVSQLSAGQPTAFVSAGDNIGASPFVSAVQDDAPTVDVLNRMGLVTSAVGNHEFDRGYDFLADDDTHGLYGDGLAAFTSLGANVEGEQPQLAPYDIVDLGGVRVGFVGVVTQQTPSLVSAEGIAGITFTDPTPAANAAAALLSDGLEVNGEADVVVLLAHEGAESETADPASCAALAAGTAGGAFGDIVSGASEDIDVVVGGHTHLTVDCDIPRAGGVMPVVEANSYGTSIGQIDLTVDSETGEVLAAAGQVVDVIGGGFTPDAVVQCVVNNAVAAADVVGRVPVGQITGNLTRAFTSTGGDDRGSESALGNFIADVQLDATAEPGLGGAQIAFMNPGGIRADLLFDASGDEGDGVVTYAEAATVQPFANGVITMTLTGEQVRQVLEQQWQPAGSSRPVPRPRHLGGALLHLRPGAPPGRPHRLGHARRRGSRPRRGVPRHRQLVPGHRGDNFTVLAQGTQRQDNGFNDLNVLVDYFAANSPVTPDLERRRALAGTDPGAAGPLPSAPPAAPAAPPGPPAAPANCDALGGGPAPTPTPTPTPSVAPGTVAPSPGATGARGGSNPGLRVDTGRTDPAPAAPVAALLLLLLAAAGGGAAVAARRSRGTH